MREKHKRNYRLHGDWKYGRTYIFYANVTKGLTMNLKFLIKQSRELFLLCTIGSVLLTTAFLGGVILEAKDTPYPVGPIQIIVPWAPGSATDLVPRVMVPKLSKTLGVPVNILNKPGGSGVVGTLEAVKASPDGHTILSECSATSSIQLAWYKELPYKVEERTFIARAVSLSTGIVVNANSPWNNLQDVEQAIRKNPASFRWGMIGSSQPDIAIYQIKAALASKGVDLSQTKTVTFSGGTAETLVGLAGGHIDIFAGGFGVVQSLLKAGKLKVIAVASADRSKYFPGVTTTAQQGFPSVNTSFWVGYSGPPGLPKNIVQTWINRIQEIVNASEMVSEWEKIGVIPAFLGGDEFKKFVMTEAEEIKAASVR